MFCKKRLSVRLFAIAIPLLIGAGVDHISIQKASAQGLPNELGNGDFEQANDTGFDSWNFFPVSSGYEIKADKEDKQSGEQSAWLDGRNSTIAANGFANLSQVLSAQSYRGKKVRFRAAVRIADAENGARAQLWFRVDRPEKDGQRQFGAFDNMQQRPIRSGEWKEYEIVLKVDDDATQIILGMLMFGKASFRIDSASFEIVADDTPTTERKVATRPQNAANDSSTKKPSGPPTPKGLQSQEPQPFFTAWLILPIIGILLMVVSQIGVRQRSPDEELLPVDLSQERLPVSILKWIRRYSFRFAFIYWIIYCLPQPVQQIQAGFGFLFPKTFANFNTWLAKINQWEVAPVQFYQAKMKEAVEWVASNRLGIEYELVMPAGSGDTTYNFVQLLLYFVVAISVAGLWSLCDWRRTDHPWLRDGLRSYIRFILAITMLSYGLAKVGWAINQFPEPNVDRLMKTYGDSSPMNLVWTFMGASRPYTIFAGMGEVIGALLLVWRRTSMIGSAVIIGVMLNVVMLNFCYDVPVKQYSFHLFFMAVFLLLADSGRLANIFVWNRPAQAVDMRPPFTNHYSIWVHRVIKVLMIAILIGIPIWQRAQMESNYQETKLAQPEFFGAYQVEKFEKNGELMPPVLTDASRWKSISFQRLPYGPGGVRKQTDYMMVRMMNGMMGGGFVTIDEEIQKVELPAQQPSVPKVISIKSIDEKTIEISGNVGEDEFKIRCRRVTREDFLLVNRGFHWINETPYNR